MDYEKKYKEALIRTKKLKETCDSTAVVGWCEYLFPELTQSEDEKIRKTLLDFFSVGARNGEQTNGVCDKDILTWLEKQKERIPLSKDEEYTLARIIEYLEDNDCPSKWKELLHDFYALPYQKEQNSAWSEEDEEKFRDVIRLIEQGTPVQSMRDHYTNWLKSLKQRMKEK